VSSGDSLIAVCAPTYNLIILPLWGRLMSFRLAELNDSNAADWEGMNENSPQGSLFHTLKWKRLLEESFRFATRYFLIYQDNQPVALCPFFVRRSYGFKYLISLPDTTLNPCNHVVMDDQSCIPEKSVGIFEDICRSESMSFVAFGVSEEQRSAFARLGVPLYSPGGRMVLDLSENPPDWIWKHRFSNNERNKIRRFDKDGFSLDHLASPESLAVIYPYYAANLRYIGAQPHPLSYFERLLTTCSGRSPASVVLTTLRKGECVAGGFLSLYWNARRILYWRYFALNRSLPNVYTPYYYLLWHTVKEAYETGCRFVDFGGAGADPMEIHTRMKEKFGCHYVPKYRAILPVSRLTKLLHWAYRFSARHGVVVQGLAPQ
jgi:hypothetical protein